MPDWVAAAFQLQPKETSSFNDDKRGGYFAVRLDGVIPPTVRPLADVRAEIAATLTRQRQAEQSAKRADELAAKLKAGATMAQIATEAGQKVETSAAATRDPASTMGGPPPALVDALFQLGKVGEITTVETADGRIIARLSEIRAADPKAAGEKLNDLRQELDKALLSDTLAEYKTGLRESAKVKINPRAAEIVAGQ
jgi:peptidyl-prolyl cis-trans isomerase D